MMSPISIAQYLPPTQELFDVVIFDEASQITVWDAIGAIARGRQVVVAGDPRQMPPTSFFARSDDDADEDIVAEGDLESILDEMLGAGIPERKLNLHYRSRSEDLIAFSNFHYYESTLITFPAPHYVRGADGNRGIRLERPKGVYARGRDARHNQGEAKAIVQEIVARLSHRDGATRCRSIGVVTINAQQQTLIENLLDHARERHPEIEWAFAPEVAEPVFVKNLETVQGDERDVILLSITYGPDQSGRVTMNFGPLNRQGGERRLNVAITRARTEMVVFSTLDPQHIDLSRSQAQAVRDLKHFLEYADNPSKLGAEADGPVGDFESPFEAAVAEALRTKGWSVHPQVGVSAYRIDLGVVHPDMPGRYLVGVECDGWMYHSSAYARERDKIRQRVLEGLGWTLIRIWSTDWWTDRKGALDKVDDTLRQHLHADRRARKEAQRAAVTDASAQRDNSSSDTIPDSIGDNITASFGEACAGDSTIEPQAAGKSDENDGADRSLAPGGPPSDQLVLGLEESRQPDTPSTLTSVPSAGECFSRGEQCRSAGNDTESVHWYRHAANAGHARAQNHLGAMFSLGRGVLRSDEQAVMWFRRAAAQGDAVAHRNLGRAFKEGFGVPQGKRPAKPAPMRPAAEDVRSAGA